MSDAAAGIDDAGILAGLRGERPPPGAEAGFGAARDAWLARQAAPRNRQLHAAVAGTVEILRDKAGVAHVFASHTADVYFGLGLAMAEDRLWQAVHLRATPS